MSKDQHAANDPGTAGAPHPAARRGVTLDHDVEQQLVEADLLVEEVSIDGMCGVY